MLSETSHDGPGTTLRGYRTILIHLSASLRLFEYFNPFPYSLSVKLKKESDQIEGSSDQGNFISEEKKTNKIKKKKINKKEMKNKQNKAKVEK